MEAFSLLLSVYACMWVCARVLFDLLFNRKWHAADLFTKSQLCPLLLSVPSSILQTHLVSNLLPTLNFHDDFLYISSLYFWEKNDLKIIPTGPDSRYLDLITYFAHLMMSWHCLPQNNPASGVRVACNCKTSIVHVWPLGGKQHKHLYIMKYSIFFILL